MYSDAHPRAYPACSGCSLCRLVCPMWRSQRDPRFSPEGLAKARQCGAAAADLAAPLQACSLCGACDPVCPERIDLSAMIMELRRELPPDMVEIGDRPQFHESRNRGLSPISFAQAAASAAAAPAGALLLPGAGLRADAALLAHVLELLGIRCATDDGADIALALESGGAIDPVRRRRFLDMLAGRTLVVGDGLLLRKLRHWLPGVRLQSLGEALGSLPSIRRRLTSTDFYVIEPRAYHADYERLVTYYDGLRGATGCTLNLDLQRIAMPAREQPLPAFSAAAGDGQTRWLLQGRSPRRIVVENPADRAAFARVCDVPVRHLAELAED